MNRVLRMLRGRGAAPQAPVPPPSQTLTVARDDALRGWLNAATGEVCPGFAVGPGDVVADIGCGGGGYAQFCAARGAKLILAEIDPAALARATAGLQAMQPLPSFETHLTSGGRLGIADGAASRVICTEVIEHVEDPVLMLDELFRIGRPGALYLLTCPDPDSEAIFKRIAHPCYFERPNHIRIIGREEFAAMVERAGLVIERRLTRGFYWLIWWALFWGCAEISEDMRHPVLDSWTATWAMLLDQKNGARVKNALDDMLPNSQVIIARKP